EAEPQVDRHRVQHEDEGRKAQRDNQRDRGIQLAAATCTRARSRHSPRVNSPPPTGTPTAARSTTLSWAYSPSNARFAKPTNGCDRSSAGLAASHGSPSMGWQLTHPQRMAFQTL